MGGLCSVYAGGADTSRPRERFSGESLHTERRCDFIVFPPVCARTTCCVGGQEPRRRCLPSPCSERTEAVCGPRPPADTAGEATVSGENNGQRRLPPLVQVTHNYPDERPTRTAHVRAVKNSRRLVDT